MKGVICHNKCLDFRYFKYILLIMCLQVFYWGILPFYSVCKQTLCKYTLCTFMNPKACLPEPMGNGKIVLTPQHTVVFIKMVDETERQGEEGMVGNKEQREILCNRESQPLLCKGIAVTPLGFKPPHAHIHEPLQYVNTLSCLTPLSREDTLT